MGFARAALGTLAALGWFAPLAALAQIGDTRANVAIRVEDQSGTFRASQAGPTAASRQVTSALGSTMTAALSLGPIAEHAATLNFEYAIAGGPGANGRMTADGPNVAEFSLQTSEAGELSIGWNFAYTGPNPYGLFGPRVSVNGEPVLALGDEGFPGHHEGGQAIPLAAGAAYLVRVSFAPDARGGISTTNGRLQGALAFEFEPTTTPSLCAVPTLVGTPGNDVLRGTAGPDVIDGLAGADIILGLGGDDVICGGEGSDVIVGGAGDDVIEGGPGNDNISAEAGDDVVDGGAGADNVSGGDGDDVLHGGPGGDNLAGEAGNDTAVGGPDADSCSAELETECEH